MSGIIHSYYVVVMAPAIGALVGGGVTELWSRRGRAPRRSLAGIILATALIASAVVAWLLLGRTPSFAPGLAIAVVAIAAVTAVIMALPAVVVDRRIQVAAVAVAIAALLAGPVAYAIDTMQTAYGGGDPSAGPQVANAAGFGGPNGGPGAFQGGGQGGVPAGAPGFGGAAGGPNGGPGGEDVSSALTDYLVANRGSARWIVAVTSANQAGSIELATGLPVMAMGGFSGTDPAPTLAQLQADIASGELRFVIVGGGGGPGGGQSEITDWVIANCTPVSSVSANLYDCAGAVT